MNSDSWVIIGDFPIDLIGNSWYCFEIILYILLVSYSTKNVQECQLNMKSWWMKCTIAHGSPLGKSDFLILQSQLGAFVSYVFVFYLKRLYFVYVKICKLIQKLYNRKDERYLLFAQQKIVYSTMCMYLHSLFSLLINLYELQQ